MRLIRTGWQLGLNKASLRLVNGFITWHCEMRKLETIWNISQLEYCRVFSNWEELETIEHLFYNCSTLSRLKLKTLDRDFFKGLNSVSRAEIKALHKCIISLSCLRSVRALLVSK